MDDLFNALQVTEIFNKLSKEDCQELVSLARYRKLSPKEFLSYQGDVWPYVLYLASGRMRWVMLSIGGKEHLLFTVEAGEVFWAHSIFDDQPMPASLEVMDAADVYLWPRDAILPVLNRNPQAMWAICAMLTQIMRRAREIIYGLAFQPVAGRLATFLLDSTCEGDSHALERNLTLDDIATIVAASPEVVCRLLYQFQRDGVLEITRASIVLHDRVSLENLVEGA